jgi:RND family efflux transporter MFP subunit
LEQRWAPRWLVDRVLTYFLSCLLCVLGVGCAKPQPAPDDQPTLVGPESLATVERHELSSGPLLSGSLEARARSQLIAEVSGSVLMVNVDLGDHVARGDVLARIETNGLGAGYASAKQGQKAAEEALSVARSNLSRTQRLVASGAEPLNQLDAERSAVKAAEAQLAAARAQETSALRQLGVTVVRAPLDGVVSELSVHEGDVVAPGSKLVSIIDPSSMRLMASVTPDDLPSVQQGAQVEFRVRGVPDRKFSGKVERIAPAADPVTRRVKLLVSLPNPDRTLLAGLFAEGRVATQRHMALCLPEDAIEHGDRGASVTALRSGEAAHVDVKLGIEDSRLGLVEIESGLSQGERVLRGAARSIKDGTRLRALAGPQATEALSEPQATDTKDALAAQQSP